MIRNPLACLVVVLAATLAPAQLVGSFSIPKKTYRAGDRSDPVIVKFTLKHIGDRPLTIVSDDTPSICTGYFVEVFPLSKNSAPLPRGVAGDCLGEHSIQLPPGASRTETLNVASLIPGGALDQPGRYKLVMTRNVVYAEEGKPYPLSQRSPHRTFVRTAVITMNPKAK